MKGKIVRWIDNRGFGFINSDEEKGDIFAHISNFEKGYRRPQINDEVEFEIERKNKKRSAISISIVGLKPTRNKAAQITTAVVILGLVAAAAAFYYFSG